MPPQKAVKLGVATKTIGGCLARSDRLYEQEPGGGVCPLPAWKVRAAMDQVVGRLNESLLIIGTKVVIVI